MPYCRRSIAALLAILLVMGCAGLTAFRTSGERVIYTTAAYYTAVDSDGFIGSITHYARSAFSTVTVSIFGTYISAPHAASGEYSAIFFDGQIITAPQIRTDTPDNSVQIAKCSDIQPITCVDPAKQKDLPAPLHLATKEKVELLM